MVSIPGFSGQGTAKDNPLKHKIVQEENRLNLIIEEHFQKEIDHLFINDSNQSLQSDAPEARR